MCRPVAAGLTRHAGGVKSALRKHSSPGRSRVHPLPSERAWQPNPKCRPEVPALQSPLRLVFRCESAHNPASGSRNIHTTGLRRVRMSKAGEGNARLGKTSGRSLLKSAGASGAAAFSQAAHGQAGRPGGTILAYVGSYTLPAGPDGMIGRGQGIYILEMDPAT